MGSVSGAAVTVIQRSSTSDSQRTSSAPSLVLKCNLVSLVWTGLGLKSYYYSKDFFKEEL